MKVHSIAFKLEDQHYVILQQWLCFVNARFAGFVHNRKFRGAALAALKAIWYNEKGKLFPYESNQQSPHYGSYSSAFCFGHFDSHFRHHCLSLCPLAAPRIPCVCSVDFGDFEVIQEVVNKELTTESDVQSH